MKKIYGYARVSTREQNLDRQIIALTEYGVGERDIITDKASGKTLERPGYQMLRNQLLREGDTLVIASLDRLSRNKHQIQEELRYYKDLHIRLVILDMPTTMDPAIDHNSWIFEMVNNILIEVLSSLAEQERVRTLERQRQGIDAAKQKGKHLGRPKTEFPDGWYNLYLKWESDEITAAAVMRQLNLPKTTFYNMVKRQKKLIDED